MLSVSSFVGDFSFNSFISQEIDFGVLNFVCILQIDMEFEILLK